jgi:hypothetical protein
MAKKARHKKRSTGKRKAASKLVTTRPKSRAVRKTSAAAQTVSSPRVTAFIKRHEKTGELVDLYASGWFAEALKAGELQVRSKGWNPATAPKGRFLLLALDPYRKETKAALRSTWKAMSEVIDVQNMWSPRTKHNPDFIAWNAQSGHIVAFGLGRKGRDFLYAIDGAGNILESELSVADFLKKASPFKVGFFAGDVAGVLPFLLEQFVRLSAGWQKFGTLPLFPEDAKARMRRKDDTYSKKELQECYDVGTRSEAAIDAAERHFRSIFKCCKVLSWELNPEDF